MESEDNPTKIKECEECKEKRPPMQIFKTEEGKKVCNPCYIKQEEQKNLQLGRRPEGKTYQG